MKISVLITCHDRKSKTLLCLDALYQAKLPAGFHLEVVLVDDGSTDGTSGAVSERYPDVTLFRGDGTLFWSRGMYEAQAIATRADPDFILWLNDDTLLFPSAIERLLAAFQEIEGRSLGPAIVVGATSDPVTGVLTYGGATSRNRLKRFTYAKVWDPKVPVECEAINGNIALIPKEIVIALGNIDPEFEHAMGDTDYSLRARQKGFRVFVAPGFVGQCSANPSQGTFRDESLPVSVRWKKFIDRKGFPPRSWLHFVRRHGGFAWPLYFAYPYLNFIARAVRKRAYGLVKNGS